MEHEGCVKTEEDLFKLEELQKEGKLLKTRKSMGLDGISNEIIKKVIDFYPETLLRTYNTCLLQRVTFYKAYEKPTNFAQERIETSQ